MNFGETMATENIVFSKLKVSMQEVLNMHKDNFLHTRRWQCLMFSHVEYVCNILLLEASIIPWSAI